MKPPRRLTGGPCAVNGAGVSMPHNATWWLITGGARRVVRPPEAWT